MVPKLTLLPVLHTSSMFCPCLREHLNVYRGLLTQLTPKLLISTADPRMPFLKWGAHSTLASGASLALPRVSSVAPGWDDSWEEESADEVAQLCQQV